MPNRYFIVEADRLNQFIADVDLTLNGKQSEAKVKIDTGCGHTTIPLQRLNYARHKAQRLKRVELERGNPNVTISFGANDSEEKKAYDRVNNILIGMDVLSMLDSHMGISRKTGKMTFLACPKTSLNEDYFNALYEHYGLRH